MSSLKTESSPTIGQASRILGLINETKSNRKIIQGVIENGDLLTLILECPDLSRVDRKAFEKTLFPWTPVEEYADRILSRSDSMGWRITKPQIRKLINELHDHSNILRPTGVDIRIGHLNFAGNYIEATSWLEKEVRKFNLSLLSTIRPTLLCPRSLENPRRQNSLKAVKLDIGKYWNSRNSSNIQLKDAISSTDNWPGLATIWLLALNPQICSLIGKTLPFLYLAGLKNKVDVGSVPLFWTHDGNVLSLTNVSSEPMISNSTVVAYQV